MIEFARGDLPATYPIARMLKAEYSYSEIARTINKNVGSVSRHVRENGGKDRYDIKELKRWIA